MIPTGAMLNTQGFGNKPANIPFYSNADPASNNVNFPLGQRWLCPSGEYVLTSFSSANNNITATWTLLGSNAGYQISSAATTPGSLSGGTLLVTDNACHTSSIVIITGRNLGGTVGFWVVIPGSGNFTISSSSSTDTSDFFYIIVNP